MMSAGGSSFHPLSSGRPRPGSAAPKKPTPASKRSTFPKKAPVSPSQGRLANLSRELVDRGDEKGGKATVNRLVDRRHGKGTAAGEIACGIGAPDFHIGRRGVVRHTSKRRRREFRPAPRARLQWGRGP